MEGYGMGVRGLGWRPVADSWEHGNKISASRKSGKFLDGIPKKTGPWIW